MNFKIQLNTIFLYPMEKKGIYMNAEILILYSFHRSQNIFLIYFQTFKSEKNLDPWVIWKHGGL